MDQLGFFKDNSKSHDADMQSSDGAMKSDISTEIISGGFENSKKTQHRINAVEDGLNATALDSQQRTESSCSSSLPVTFSNHSYQTNCVGPTDSSNSKTTSSESGVSAQIARTAVINARAKNSMKISLVNEISHEDGEVVAGFDLNEDIIANETDDYIKPVNETNVFSSRVIHVLAKTGIPSGQPKIPLKFEGGLGWKGSSGTSAFRPANSKKTCFSNERRKEPMGFSGIDLNIAAVEDNADLQDSCFEVFSSKRAKNPSFDLNCLYNGDDELNQISLQPESRNPTLVDLNKKISDSAKTGKRDFEFTRQDYLAHLSMQNMANTNILQPVDLMQRVASLQPNFPFMPSHNYPSVGPFHLPYGRYSQEYGTVNALFGTPYLVQKHNGPKTEDQEAWYAASVKRKEPEGGLEFYQLGYKQVT